MNRGIMNVFCYIMYQTKGKNRGTFRVRVDHHKLRETLNFSKTIPVNEFGDACKEFARCINRIDAGLTTERLFHDSALSSEIMAYYFLSSSEALKKLYNTSNDSSLHLTYTFNADNDGKFTSTENIYPGPDSFAPAHVIEHWMSKAQYG